jgi:2-polyprenyl-3-methyl-5-hydroxy-6-metoxy-1,4-benzoquinol methylase
MSASNNAARLARTERIWRDEARVEDGWADVYDRIYGDLQPCYNRYKESVADLVIDQWKPRRGRILEVGCGTGAVLRILQARGVAPGHLAGVDISARMIQVAASKLPGAQFAATPIEKYQGGPFSVVYFCGSLHHMPDQSMVARKLDEIIQPGGAAVVAEPNEQWLFHRLWLNRATRAVNPWWLWLRWTNRARIRELGELMDPMQEPAFHEHIEARSVEDAFSGRFRLIHHQTKFAWTRLFEGVVMDNPRSMAALARLDNWSEALWPDGGGAVEMVFERL